MLSVPCLTVGRFSVGVIAHVIQKVLPVLGPGPDPGLGLSPSPRIEDGGTRTPARALAPGVGPGLAQIPQTRIGTGGVSTCEYTHLCHLSFRLLRNLYV